MIISKRSENKLNACIIETKRLTLRKFTESDMSALYKILSDDDVNTFLPWFPVKNMTETEDFYKRRIANQDYCFAICLKEDNIPIGYVKAGTDESHDFGYALRKEFWHRGLVTEAGSAVIGQLKKGGIPYITATHDINNPRSGRVMQRLGMKYKYSYEEQWQPKDFLVTFRMYQLNLDGKDNRVYKKYWVTSSVHFTESNDAI